MTTIIDGRRSLQNYRVNCGENSTIKRKRQGVVHTGLVVTVVGDNPASKIYVRNKERSAIAAGFRSEVRRLPESISQAELLEVIEHYNQESPLA